MIFFREFGEFGEFGEFRDNRDGRDNRDNSETRVSTFLHSVAFPLRSLSFSLSAVSSVSVVSVVSVVSLVPFVFLFKNKDPEGVNLRGLDLVLWTKPANDYKLGLIFDHSSIAGTIPKVTNSSRILQRCAYEASSLAISSSVPTGILYEQPFWSRTVSIAIMMWL